MRSGPKRRLSGKREMLTARLEQGTWDRITQVLKGGELHSAFVRAAIEAELHARETAAKRRQWGSTAAVDAALKEIV